MIPASHMTQFDRIRAAIADHPVTERRLSQLQEVFADEQAYQVTLAELGDVLVYSVASVEPATGDGQLHYGIGRIYPGRVGQEYFMTRGHLHEWRPAAEFYIGLSGEGIMLLEDEKSGEAYSMPLLPDGVVYVPGYTAHRTVNTGDTPLTYLGIYPAQAGHDYASIADNNFRQVVIAVDGKPAVIERQEFLASLV